MKQSVCASAAKARALGVVCNLLLMVLVVVERSYFDSKGNSTSTTSCRVDLLILPIHTTFQLKIIKKWLNSNLTEATSFWAGH